MHLEDQIDRFPEIIHFDTDQGWDFNVGYPEFWALKSKLVVPGGRVLDLGSEFGYNSLMFALSGMKVEAIDNDPKAVMELRKIAANRDLAIKVREEDVITAHLETNSYDLVLLNDLLTHMHPKTTSYDVLDNAIAAVKPGGHIFLRATGKDSIAYLDYKIASEKPPYMVPGTYDFHRGGYHTAELIAPDSFTVKCLHHAGHGPENGVIYSFYEQNEFLFHFIHNGLGIVLASTVPSANTPNIMFGEDMRHDAPQFGIITLLGQKPLDQIVGK